ncbi:phage head completion protein [Kitasatospora purpeofusca]|uniref:phage head completion protein n=1 Tax=Kitasatospora purpeofusca TaxID=67352 RepID=UPI0037FA5036
MSLTDRGRDRVVVHPIRDVDDGYGGTQPGVGDPVTVWASVRPATAEESTDTGFTTETLYRLSARSLPAGPWSRVEWDGAVWTVVGEPQHFRGHRRVTYDAATIRKRGNAVGHGQAEH